MRRLAPVVILCALSAAPSRALAGDQARTVSVLRHQLAAAGASAGAAVVDLSTGQRLFTWNPDRRLVPASVNKLYTTSTALRRFGPAGRLSTTAHAGVPPDAHGVVDGDLYLRGAGDPSFATADARALAQRLADGGLTEVTGRIVGDESAFDGLRGVPSSRYKPSRYVGVLSALTFRLNLNGPHFVLDPARRAAAAFRTELRRAGVRVRGRWTTGVTPVDATLLGASQSPSMAVLTQFTNRTSSNFYAEQLVKALGAEFGGAGSTASGTAVVRRSVASLAGIHPAIVDGSGLARANRSSAADIAALLTKMHEAPEQLAFSSSLAVAGRNGTLEDRMRKTLARGRCVGKTGTLLSVSALAGYCTTRDGRAVAYAFLMNAISPFTARKLQDRAVEALARAQLAG